jgi:membrane protein DedA with SNARE-associated domain/rhodanese-related sulfurtransferase
MDLLDLLARFGVVLVFVAVLLEQGGLPLPAAPLLVVADQAWFFLGRRFGRRVLANICRVSLSPDTCVRKTDDLITRHGPAVLLVAKFIPGVSAVAIPTASAMGLPWRRFVAFDTVGCLLWSGAYIGLGMIFSREVNRLLATLDVVGAWSIGVVVAIFALYIAWKLAHRFRLKRLHRLVRISPDDLLPLLAAEPGLVIVDARSDLARTEDPRQLPRAVILGELEPLEALAGHQDRIIVTFCTCPNEASAALLAEQLLRAGFARVRVLTYRVVTITSHSPLAQRPALCGSVAAPRLVRTLYVSYLQASATLAAQLHPSRPPSFT